MPEYRAKGYGSEFLKILLDRYSDRVLVIESDDPSAAKNPEKHNEAVRRVKFYERVGFHIMPTKKAKIFGVEYLIMASGNDENLSAKEILHSLYLSAFKSKIWLNFIDVEDL
jgi:ribosomal protein S18 acetylase RimI-like enzyme